MDRLGCQKLLLYCLNFDFKMRFCGHHGTGTFKSLFQLRFTVYNPAKSAQAINLSRKKKTRLLNLQYGFIDSTDSMKNSKLKEITSV